MYYDLCLSLKSVLLVYIHYQCLINLLISSTEKNMLISTAIFKVKLLYFNNTLFVYLHTRNLAKMMDMMCYSLLHS